MDGDDELPPGWMQKSNDEGKTRFEHESFQIGTWKDPRTSQSAGPVTPGWTSGRNQRRGLKDESQRIFFVNLTTGETTFEDPGMPTSTDVSEVGGFRII